ncbi:LOW QUALITY PROTEIN: hypothetical protein OSB04_007566 [Centaurea solstitialis]|uniref:Integrase catalytic domain-containing protein n=1 Tax=Centaurea solstitialis TaxID=347529 RepID=A0AA38TVM1_9ASTR|nr:LOW QUALITY PROTEIN: hypothetical protein OSB04_007566 [Centaurea solstitialis]
MTVCCDASYHGLDYACNKITRHTFGIGGSGVRAEVVGALSLWVYHYSNLSMSQQRWLDVVKDYDCEILYHPSKANMVVNTLSRKAHSVVMRVPIMRLTWDLKIDYGWPGLKRVVARYVKEMMTRHGVLVTEVSEREERFISRFWGRFYEGMGIRLQFCTAFYPYIDGQNERARQTLEIMLRACVSDFGSTWDTYLPVVGFLYNNSFHASIGMPPCEMLYG